MDSRLKCVGVGLIAPETDRLQCGTGYRGQKIRILGVALIGDVGVSEGVQVHVTGGGHGGGAGRMTIWSKAWNGGGR